MLELLVSENRGFYQDILAWVVCVAALIFGSGPERAAAVVWILFFELATSLYEPFASPNFRFLDVDLVVIGFDFFAGAFWISIALFANRNYPMWIAGLQLVALTAHLARGLTEVISPLAYATMAIAPSWLQLLLLAGGVAMHRVRLGRFGEYRDWRVSRTRAVGPLASTGLTPPPTSTRNKGADTSSRNAQQSAS